MCFLYREEMIFVVVLARIQQSSRLTNLLLHAHYAATRLKISRTLYGRGVTFPVFSRVRMAN